MANDLTGNPLKVDTAATILAATLAVSIKSIRWVGAAAAGDELIIEDASGRVIFHAVATGANYTEPHYPQVPFRGLVVDTIDSGIVYIEV